MQGPWDVAVIQVELKYCEACGGLWLRVRGSQQVYCERCAEKMSGIALGKAGRHVH